MKPLHDRQSKNLGAEALLEQQVQNINSVLFNMRGGLTQEKAEQNVGLYVTLVTST